MRIPKDFMAIPLKGDQINPTEDSTYFQRDPREFAFGIFFI